jgi:hypothetical protein
MQDKWWCLTIGVVLVAGTSASAQVTGGLMSATQTHMS